MKRVGTQRGAERRSASLSLRDPRCDVCPPCAEGTHHVRRTHHAEGTSRSASTEHIVEKSVLCRSTKNAFSLEQVTGLEPVISAWKANVLPLHYTCLVRAKRFELIRLAALEPKSSASANSATPALQEAGDPSEIRTPDPLIKSQMLCQLS